MPNYVMGSPLFDEITINFDDGSTFEVSVKNNSPENLYIQSVMLNGLPYEKAWLNHFDIINGGKLELEMGAEPNLSFGKIEKDLPPSMSTGGF